MSATTHQRRLANAKRRALRWGCKVTFDSEGFAPFALYGPPNERGLRDGCHTYDIDDVERILTQLGRHKGDWHAWHAWLRAQRP